ncbi:extracellular solute-binding protein [Plantactinospora sp. KBS50]|uniref:ABC transporter substrate-binding protein n=1 Tax=Plantactinospora sp. KBS50 TaxID=2024580 RepID=UPI000BAB00CD|nr:extracellular solute-binding protein [Plantactinospora sp. KBS50]ASW54420.1 sugar ABC transporter substrate-binding protein [Plantactinospora sp. KBS50]
MHELSRRRLLFGAAGVAGAAAFTLAGCGSDSSSKDSKDLSKNKVGAMDDFGVGTQFKATAPIKFSIAVLSNPGYPYKADWMFWSELSKRTNISFDPTVIPLSDYNQKRSVMISGGNAPSIIPKTYHPGEEEYIASGAILPVSDYLDLMPNFKDKVAKWKLESNIDGLRQADGKFYLLPGLHEAAWQDYTLAARTDVLEKLGIATPQTWDDITNMLRAIKQAYPDKYPLSDRWSNAPGPGANNLLGILSTAYGTYAGWAWQSTHWDDGAKKFVYSGSMDQYKQVVQYLNTLVSEKLLDPESFTQSDEDARAKFAAGKSFVISTNAQELVNSYRKDIAKISGATVAKLPLPVGPMGPVLDGTTRLENGLMISSKARDSENFVAMMQFIDWLWYSDEGELFAKWGVEGTTYTGDVNAGTFKLASDVDWAGLNPGASKALNADFGFSNGVFAYGGSTNLLNSQFPQEEQEYQKLMNQRQTLPLPPPKPLNADEREQATLWESGLRDHVDQQTLKFILGERPLSDWDAYLSELKGKSMDQYVDTVNKAYERFQKEHG